MENRGEVKSRCKERLLGNAGRNSGVWAWGNDSGRMGSIRIVQLNSGRTRQTGRSDDVSGVRTRGRRIRCMCFFAEEVVTLTPLIYPANSFWSVGRPQLIWCCGRVPMDLMLLRSAQLHSCTVLSRHTKAGAGRVY